MVELKAKEGFLLTDGNTIGTAVTCADTEAQKWYEIPIEDVTINDAENTNQ